MNEDGTISGWGARAEETFGWPRSEALGATLAELIVPEQYREAHKRGLDRFRTTGEGPVLGRVLELSALHRDGREFPIELCIAPAAQLEGSPIFIAFVLDISERSAARAELERVNGELRAAKQVTDDFVQMMVHEVRQPLGVARGYVDLTLELVEGQAERQLRIIEQKLGEAAALVDDVLLAARLSAGRHVTTTAPGELIALVRDVVANAVPSARLRDGDIAVIVPPDDVRVMLDAASNDSDFQKPADECNPLLARRATNTCRGGKRWQRSGCRQGQRCAFRDAGTDLRSLRSGRGPDGHPRNRPRLVHLAGARGTAGRDALLERSEVGEGDTSG